MFFTAVDVCFFSGAFLSDVEAVFAVVAGLGAGVLGRAGFGALGVHLGRLCINHCDQ